MQTADVIVIGGGAAGLFCAGIAGRRGRDVIVIERSAEVGRKILISGGGRCNFTNLHTEPENYISENPAFARSALARFRPEDFVELVRKEGIAFHEKKLGQLFCDGSSRQILDLLVDACPRERVKIKTGCEVRAVTGPGRFIVDTNMGRFTADSLVIASGGLSIPKIGATDFGYRMASQFGLRIVETRPGLVPLMLSRADLGRFSDLSGISFDAEVSFGKETFRENVLLTHRGLSGPAILQISSYWRQGEPIIIDLLPDEDPLEMLSAESAAGIQLSTWLSQFVPQRLARAWASIHGDQKPLRDYGPKEMRRVAEALRNWTIVPAGTEGFGKAEVTCGGVDTRELASQTMGSTKVAGLYFIGEAVDVTGHLGGFNFQWAWASGHAAGLVV